MSDRDHDQPPTADCLPDEPAVELALGLAAGRQRAESLAHLAGCSWCRTRVDGLREAGESLLLLAPPAEPPAGFEQRALGEYRASRARSSSGWRRPALRAAAAAVAVVVALGIGILVGRVRQPGTAPLASASMRTPSGVDVGTVWRHPGQPTWLFVSVPGWRRWESSEGPAPTYRLRLTLTDGRTVDLEDTFLRPDDGTWASTIAADAADVAAVSVVDEGGRVWCTGRFVGTA